jgi:ribosomal protein S8
MERKTIEGFIRELMRDGMGKRASELRYLLAMSDERKKAIQELFQMSVPLLFHLLKVIALPNAQDQSKWKNEILGYLRKFNTKNNRKRKQILNIEYIKNDLNEMLSRSSFYDDVKGDLEEYSEVDREKVLKLLKSINNLNELHVKFIFDQENYLKVQINGVLLS